MASIHDEKQDFIEEAICAGPDGQRCGCWQKECPRGCGFALEALALWKDVKKTMKWLAKYQNHIDRDEILTDLIKSLDR